MRNYNFPEEIRAGELRSRGKILKPTGDRDAHGGAALDSDTDLDAYEAEVSLGIETLQGRELFDAQRRFAEVTTLATMRFPRTFTVLPTMRLVVGTTTYDIRGAVDVNNRHKKLHLYCRELT